MQAIQEKLSRLANEADCLFSIAAKEQIPDWIVIEHERMLFHGPGRGWQETSTGRAGSLVGPASRENPAKWFYDAMQHISRATGLTQTAARHESRREPQSKDASLQLEASASLVELSATSLANADVEQMSANGELTREHIKEILNAPDGSPLGDRVEAARIIRLKYTNTGRFGLDLNVLYFDSQFGIKPLYSSAANGLLPGKSGKFEFSIAANTIGTEHIIVIATAAAATPLDLSWLEQAALPNRSQVRGDMQIAVPEHLTPLERVLHDNMSKRPATRGDTAQPTATILSVFSVEVVPSQRPDQHDSTPDWR